MLSKKQYALQEAKWLTTIPMDWRPFRLKEVVRVSPPCSGNGPNMGEACSVIPMATVTETGDFNDYETEDYEIIPSGLTNFEDGDVIFAKITPCMENGKGAFVEKLKTKYAFGSTEFHVLRPNYLIDGKFLYYYSFDPEYRKYAAENMTGAAGQKRVSTRFIEYTPVFLPDLPEQKRIAAFLERQCDSIDKVLEIKKEQLTILEDLRKSIIHKAVTKGLDNSVELVDSGVEWIGKIPKGWKVERLKTVISYICRGNSPVYDDDGTVKVINQACIYHEGLKLENVKYHQSEDVTFFKGKLAQGDLLVNSTGTGTLGRSCIFILNKEDYIADGHVTIVRGQPHKLHNKYLHYFLYDKREMLEQVCALGATNQIELQREKFRVFLIPCPKFEVQNQISIYLDKQCQDFKVLIANINKQISYLKGYRKALIHECVTGKRIITDQELKERVNV